ncbi:MAG TPA: hypothetical protein VGH57_11465 [Amycolatopsis sp.]
MRDLIMSDFLKSLAVPGTTPSGGAVAALGVAQAAALLARAAGADHELRAEAEVLRMHALRLAEKDAHAVGQFALAGLAAGAAALAACLPAADVIAAAAKALTLAERLLPASGLLGAVLPEPELSGARSSNTGSSGTVPSWMVSPDVAAVAEIARSSAMTARVAIETRLGAVTGDAAIALRATVASVDGLAERATWVTAAVRAANASAEYARVG